MSKFKNNKNKLLPLKWKGHNVVESSFSGKFTKEEIREFAQKQSNMFKKKGNGQISVALKYPIGWRSGYPSKFGDNISLYSMVDSGDEINEEPEYFENFTMYIYKQ